jgi:uncharacterized membrane protein YccC
VAPARAGTAPQRRGRPAAAGRDGVQPAAAEGGAGGAEEFDYDELARRLLLQVVHRLSTLPVEGPEPAEDTGPGEGADSDVSLARAVAGLEQKLASVRSTQQRLSEENAKLREQLRAAQESLAQAQERAAADPAAVRLDSAEVRLLERLLSPLRDKGARQEEAGAS